MRIRIQFMYYLLLLLSAQPLLANSQGSCPTGTFPLNVTIEGLEGVIGLEYTIPIGTGGPNRDQNGTFRLTCLEVGEPYEIYIILQPDNPPFGPPVNQVCDIENDSGVMQTGGIDNVLVTCGRATPFPVPTTGFLATMILMIGMFGAAFMRLTRRH